MISQSSIKQPRTVRGDDCFRKHPGQFPLAKAPERKLQGGLKPVFICLDIRLCILTYVKFIWSLSRPLLKPRWLFPAPSADRHPPLCPREVLKVSWGILLIGEASGSAPVAPALKVGWQALLFLRSDYRKASFSAQEFPCPIQQGTEKGEQAICPASHGKCHLKVSKGRKKGTGLQFRLTFPCVGGKPVIQPGTHICKRGKRHVSY